MGALLGLIVSSIISVATTVTSNLISNAASASGKPVYGTIANHSTHDFDIHSFYPNHGHAIAEPESHLKGTEFVNDEFISVVKGKHGDKYTEEQLEKEKAEWVENQTFDKHSKKCITSFGGTGDGAGFEQVIVLESKKSSLVIAILFRKIPGGDYGVGVSMSNHKWYNWKKDDDNGSKIMKHIKNIHTDKCKYADGGKEFSIKVGGVKVIVPAPATNNKIILEE